MCEGRRHGLDTRCMGSARGCTQIRLSTPTRDGGNNLLQPPPVNHCSVTTPGTPGACSNKVVSVLASRWPPLIALPKLFIPFATGTADNTTREWMATQLAASRATTAADRAVACMVLRRERLRAERAKRLVDPAALCCARRPRWRTVPVVSRLGPVARCRDLELVKYLSFEFDAFARSARGKLSIR